jgi:carbon storage regulator
MLVLSRKPGELIHIGNNVKLTVLKVSGQRVIVGLSAPAEVQIRRQEAPIRYQKVLPESRSAK